MITGRKKKDKITEIFFDEDNPVINIRTYNTAPETLTAEMVNNLIDKIIVHAPDKSSGHRTQKVDIYYKAIGITNIADDERFRKNTSSKTDSMIKRIAVQPLNCIAIA